MMDRRCRQKSVLETKGPPILCNMEADSKLLCFENLHVKDFVMSYACCQGKISSHQATNFSRHGLS